MQVTINIPDDLPAHIVQQYISTIEVQMTLMSQLSIEKPLKTKLSRLKRGSATKDITFIDDDFCEPLDDFKDYKIGRASCRERV